MLNELGLKTIYRSTEDNFVEDFFVPVLRSAVKYDRGTGFFSIAGLIELSKGIIPYIKKGGIVRVITSIELSDEDVSVISRSHELAQTVLKAKLDSIIEEEITDEDSVLDMDLVTNLIADGKILLKIAYLENGGIYHEKTGYAEDEAGNSLWLSGSVNETYNGLKKNTESFVLIKSWESGTKDIIAQNEYFRRLWENDIEGHEIMDFPEASKNKLLKIYKKSESTDAVIKKILGKNEPTKKELFPYQKLAIEEFFENDGRHFYEMATGTGKTFTAIKTIQALSEKKEQLYVVVLLPQIDLQEQWNDELKSCGVQAHLFGGSLGTTNWKESLDRSIIDYYTGTKLVVSICVYDTYFSKIREKLIDESMDMMLVVDEAHSLSSKQLNELDDFYTYRLGLSATPEKFSKSETSTLMEYFTNGSKNTFKYSIDEAIENHFLSEYEYYPMPVRLTDEEFKQYNSLTKKISTLINMDNIDKDELDSAIMSRARVIKKAVEKLSKLKELVSSGKYDFKNSVIYCGQGKDANTEDTIIDRVTMILKDSGKLSVSQFTSKTVNRTAVLREFEAGFYDTLVAIKCFDQGVDVPKLDKIYIMASDASNRQTIQRRGRVLRRCKETNKEIAYIYDFVTFPPAQYDGTYDGKGLVAKELMRVCEYARLAKNKKDIQKDIEHWMNEYNVEEGDIHVEYDE